MNNTNHFSDDAAFEAIGIARAAFAALRPVSSERLEGSWSSALHIDSLFVHVTALKPKAPEEPRRILVMITLNKRLALDVEMGASNRVDTFRPGKWQLKLQAFGLDWLRAV